MYCRERYDFGDRPCVVWSVPDVDLRVSSAGISLAEREASIIKETERTFQTIAGLVDELLDRLARDR